MNCTRSGLVGNMALVAGSVLLSLLLLEIGTRLTDGVSLVRFPNFVASELDLLKDAADANRYDPLLGWQLREKQMWKFRENPTITIGEHGIRMNSSAFVSVPRNAILATGDSFTFGSEVEDSESWPANLERLLKRNVVNAGSGGYGVDQIVLRTENLTSILAPTTIVAVFLSQDIVRNAYDIFGGGGKPYFLVMDGKLILQNNPVGRIAGKAGDIGRLQAQLGYSYALHKVAGRINGDWWIDNNRRNRQVLPLESAVQSSCLLMHRLAGLRDETTSRIIVGFVYGGGEISSKLIPNFVLPVISCARQAGLEVVDFWDSLVKLPLDDLKRLYVMHPKRDNIWGHFSPAGNQYVAEALCSRFPDCQGRPGRKD